MPTNNDIFNGGIPPDDLHLSGNSAAQKLFEDLGQVLRTETAPDEKTDGCTLSADARLIATTDHRLSTGRSIADSIGNTVFVLLLLITCLTGWLGSGTRPGHHDDPAERYLLTLHTRRPADLPPDPGRPAMLPLERTRRQFNTMDYPSNKSIKNYTSTNRPADPAAERPGTPFVVNPPNERFVNESIRFNEYLPHLNIGKRHYYFDSPAINSHETAYNLPADSLHIMNKPFVPDQNPAILPDSSLFALEGNVFILIKDGKIHCGKTNRFNRQLFENMDELELFCFRNK